MFTFDESYVHAFRRGLYLRVIMHMVGWCLGLIMVGVCAPILMVRTDSRWWWLLVTAAVGIVCIWRILIHLLGLCALYKVSAEHWYLVALEDFAEHHRHQPVVTPHGGTLTCEDSDPDGESNEPMDQRSVGYALGIYADCVRSPLSLGHSSVVPDATRRSC